MPYYKNQIKSHLNSVLKKINEAMYTKIAKLTATAWKTKEPISYDERFKGEKQEIDIGQKWGDLWDCAWFNFKGTVPESASGSKVVLLIDLNGEGCVVDENGSPIRGLTNINSEFSRELGEPGKRVVQFLDQAQGGEKVDIWVDAGNNDLFGKYRGNGSLREADIAICNQEMRGLYYDFQLLYELMDNIPQEKARYHSIMDALNRATKVLDRYTEKEAIKAREIISPELNKKGGSPSLKISAIGHAHIDLAWLWPIRETIRKGARTFSTVLEMMERYPDYTFGASQPQLYQWMKENYPKLYKRITQKIEEGRWEVQGAMWTEADTNISGGEALVRQVLYGKRFFRDEFDKDMKVLWLPDVFGYTASLPQILKKSGVDYFMTIKLSWSDHNQFPHHTFFWEGIDGSEVLCHMPPEGTYNSPGTPRAAIKAEKEFKEKGISDRCLMLYGIGDGGGGPGAEHLESLKREKNLAGMPPVEQEFSIDFFKKIEKDSAKYKSWAGELYLEKHQGTFTTQADNKKYNRKMEIALRELEFASVLAMTYGDFEYPQEEIEELWKETLLYQFHDILPGSSIKRVHDESVARYKEMMEQTQQLTAKAYQTFGVDINQEEVDQYLAVNSLSWDRQEWVKIADNWANISVPALGSGVVKLEAESIEMVDKLVASNCILENDKLKVKFNKDGTIDSIYDKSNDKEVIDSKTVANCLAVYEDNGDAWDFPIYYDKQPAKFFKLESAEAYIDGPKAVVKQYYSFGESTLEQEISLKLGNSRVDFNTKVDWKETHKMLRTSFPLNIYAKEATCDIQFGNIKRPTHRNNSWDMAKYEIPAHKWVDLSQRDYGVALMNDSKYGHKVKDNILDLNLLRSPQYPGEDADKGIHEFVYAIYPHSGDHVSGNVIKEAYQLNIPLQIMPIASEERISCIDSFINVDSDKVIIESIKKAEDDDSLIIRLYESCGEEVDVNVSINSNIIDSNSVKVQLVDLMEENPVDLDLNGNAVELNFKPFEINTLKIML